MLDDTEVFDGVVLGDGVFCSCAASSSCYSPSSLYLSYLVIVSCHLCFSKRWYGYVLNE